MTQQVDRNQCIHGRTQNFFQGGRRNFAYPFQVADDARQTDVHKTLYAFYSFYPLVCAAWTEPKFSIFCLKYFLHFGYQKCFSFS